MATDKIVYVVHAVDTEGPLYESLQATFGRLRDLFGIRLEPDYGTLEKLQRKELDLGGKEDLVAKVLDPQLLAYNDSWDKIDRMLSRIMSREFRQALPDMDGGGWIYTWHCLDHVGFEDNPRRRDMGYHNIHDRYLEFINRYGARMDAVEWHFHPMSTYREAHRCATSYENSPHLHQALCRRIIERQFFPGVFRAGFQTERPDSHWFLEQWIPFDASNMAIEDWHEIDRQNDTKNGRFNDWRRAPNDWTVYHPDYYDYQRVGQCRRSIGRFLNINTRIACINQHETDRAFAKAEREGVVLLGVASHDFRDMAPEVMQVMGYLREARRKYPAVQFRYARARDAFNAVVNQGGHERLRLDVELYREDDCYKLRIHELEGHVFGPQPYLAVKTKSGRFIHDNLDFGLDGRSWFYVFDDDSIRSSDVDKIGVAANNKYGDSFVTVIGAD